MLSVCHEQRILRVMPQPGQTPYLNNTVCLK